MSRHAAPRHPRHIGERLTVPAVHLILGLACPSPTAAGQPGRHHQEATR
jgi:hypothetical protein